MAPSKPSSKPSHKTSTSKSTATAQTSIKSYFATSHQHRPQRPTTLATGTSPIDNNTPTQSKANRSFSSTVSSTLEIVDLTNELDVEDSRPRKRRKQSTEGLPINAVESSFPKYSARPITPDGFPQARVSHTSITWRSPIPPAKSVSDPFAQFQPDKSRHTRASGPHLGQAILSPASAVVLSSQDPYGYRESTPRTKQQDFPFRSHLPLAKAPSVDDEIIPDSQAQSSPERTAHPRWTASASSPYRGWSSAQLELPSGAADTETSCSSSDVIPSSQTQLMSPAHSGYFNLRNGWGAPGASYAPAIAKVASKSSQRSEQFTTSSTTFSPTQDEDVSHLQGARVSALSPMDGSGSPLPSGASLGSRPQMASDDENSHNAAPSVSFPPPSPAKSHTFRSPFPSPSKESFRVVFPSQYSLLSDGDSFHPPGESLLDKILREHDETQSEEE